MPDNARDFMQRTEVGPLTLQELLQGLGDVFKGRGMSEFKDLGGVSQRLGDKGLRLMDLRFRSDKGTGKTQQQGFVKQGDFYYRRGISPSGVIEYGRTPYQKKGKDFVPVKG